MDDFDKYIPRLMTYFGQPPAFGEMIERGSGQTVDLLGRMLQSDQPEQRKVAVHLLGSIWDTEDFWRNEDDLVRQEIVARRELIGPLIKMLQDEDEITRRNVIFLLNHYDDERIATILIAALEDESSWVRREAIDLLREAKCVAAVPSLIKALDDKDIFIQRSAAAALGKIGDERAVEPLISRLNSKEVSDPRAFIYALGKIGDPRAFESLLTFISKDTHWAIRETAVRWLGSVGGGQAIPILQSIRDNHSIRRAVRRAAAASLANPADPESLNMADMDGDQAGLLDDETKFETLSLMIARDPIKAIDTLAEMLNSSEPKHYAVALDLLYWIADLQDFSTKNMEIATNEIINREALISRLTELLRKKDSTIKGVAAAMLSFYRNEVVIPPLIVALKDEYNVVRSIAATALGKRKTAAAVPALIALLDDEYPSVQRDAVQALGRIGDQRAVEPLIKVLTDGDIYKTSSVWSTITSALAVLGDRSAVAPLVALAANDKPVFVRQEALRCLAHIGGDEATVVLRSVYDNHNEPWLVRRVAIAALTDPSIYDNGLWQQVNSEVEEKV